jgi:Holliday junction resolvasome RuvABC endonuclease subunit
MTKEEKLRNKEVRDYKKKNKTRLSYDSNGKRIGLIGRKHVNIRRVNEIFKDFIKVPLRKKDEDQADALGLAACYHLRRIKNEQ